MRDIGFLYDLSNNTAGKDRPYIPNETESHGGETRRKRVRLFAFTTRRAGILHLRLNSMSDSWLLRPRPTDITGYWLTENCLSLGWLARETNEQDWWTSPIYMHRDHRQEPGSNTERSLSGSVEAVAITNLADTQTPHC
jgi:hypothetical protein